MADHWRALASKPGLRTVSGRLVLIGALLGVLAACGTTARSAPPGVEVVGLTLIESSPSQQRYRVRLMFANPNAEAITIARLSFRIRLAGEGYLRGQSATPLEVPAGGRDALGVEVSSEVVSSLSRLMALVQGPEHALPYEIAGELYLAGRRGTPYSFRASGQVPLAMTQ